MIFCFMIIKISWKINGFYILRKTSFWFLLLVINILWGYYLYKDKSYFHSLSLITGCHFFLECFYTSTNWLQIFKLTILNNLIESVVFIKFFFWGGVKKKFLLKTLKLNKFT